MPLLICYLWAFPVTIVGYLLAGVGLITGGRVHFSGAVVEQHGGLVGWVLHQLGTACITLGYVTLGRTLAALDLYREHERVHMRQYGTWGVFLLPAYLVSSVWVWLHHRDPWKDNYFERRAIEASGI